MLYKVRVRQLLKGVFFYLGFSDLDVLTWWKTNGIKYLTLQMIV